MENKKIREYMGLLLMMLAFVVYILGTSLFFGFGAILLFFLGFYIKNMN